MEIVIDLYNIDKGIRKVDDYAKHLETKATEYVKQMAILGKSEATSNFQRAQYDGTNDVKVTYRQRKKTATISASGESVLFIEFGTGVRYPDNHPEKPVEIVGRGQYGYRLGRLEKGWRYPIEKGPGTAGTIDPKHPDHYHTYGNPANKCMYNAKKKMEAQAFKVAKEVFK